MKKVKQQKPRLVVPPHRHQAAHDRLMEKVAKMTDDEFFQTLVDAGIYTPDGRVTEAYTHKPEHPPRSGKHRHAA